MGFNPGNPGLCLTQDILGLIKSRLSLKPVFPEIFLKKLT
jgi:hypothetical protein